MAYRTAASEALTNAKIEERTVDDTLTVLFEYPFMNDVMRIVKEEQPRHIGAVIRHGLPHDAPHPSVDDGQATRTPREGGDVARSR